VLYLGFASLTLAGVRGAGMLRVSISSQDFR